MATTTDDTARLIRVSKIGGIGPYKYTRADDGDDATVRPCGYPITLDRDLAPDLRQADDWDQARAIVQMLACQMARTGWIGGTFKRRPDKDELEWAKLTDEARVAAELAERIPGTCSGCNSTPCRCLA